MYSPKDMLQLYVYVYLNKVRSSRRLEIESKRNLEVMWLLKKLSPDHKTIARFRKDNAKALKNVFKDFVRLCMKLNLYGKELIAIDGSKFKAVNSKNTNFTMGKLEDRIARIELKIEEYFKQMNSLDIEENVSEKKFTTSEITSIILELNSKREEYKDYQNNF